MLAVPLGGLTVDGILGKGDVILAVGMVTGYGLGRWTRP